jgi:hypothetical protein
MVSPHHLIYICAPIHRPRMNGPGVIIVADGSDLPFSSSSWNDIRGSHRRIQFQNSVLDRSVFRRTAEFIRPVQVVFSKPSVPFVSTMSLLIFWEPRFFASGGAKTKHDTI